VPSVNVLAPPPGPAGRPPVLIPPPAPHRFGPVVVAGAALAACAALAAAGALAGCGVPPELRPKPGSSVPRPSTPASASPSGLAGSPTAVVLPPQATTASAEPTFAEEYAVECAGRPSADQVIALVRRTGGLLPRTGSVTVTKGPLCAGTWQYTVFSVPGKEPLQVVSRGAPDDLTMVTAGTDVCSIPVRTAAPVGIRSAALCPATGT
jgi:hypothetical protein